MTSSTSISTLAAALVAAQKAFAPAIKAKANPAFKGALYVDLASAIEAAQPALLDNGIAVLQGTSGDVSTQSITVTTRLLHGSGEWIEDSLTLPAVNRGDFSAQSAGSAITYARRYSYMAILGFAPEDDDGNAASMPTRPEPQQRSAPVQHPAPSRSPNGVISEAQSKRFFAMAKQGGKSLDDIKKYLMDVCKCERSADMSRSSYEAACKWAEEPPVFVYQPPTEITDDDISF